MPTCSDFIKEAAPPRDPTQVEAFKQQKALVLPLADTFDATGHLTDAQESIVRSFHARWFPVLTTPVTLGTATPIDPNVASNSAALAMFSIRQWAADQPGAPASALQIALGTLVDVAVLWFANDPGAISTSRPEGKALKAFLQALQTVDFAHASTTTIITDTMVAVLDTVAAQPGLITSGKRETALITAATTSLATALKKIPIATLDGLNTNDVEQLSFIAQSFAAATLRAGAETVLDNPKLFYIDGPDGPETKVVEQVGKAFIDLILPVSVGGQAKIDLSSAVSANGFETLVRATLAAVGNNPAILHLQGDSETRLSPLLADLATSFAKATLPKSVQAAFAETAAIVLSATDRHMDTLWPNNSLDPAQNLARGAVVAALDAVAGIAGGTGGISAFTTADMVSIADAVVASVAQNPKLMSINPGGNPYLKVALDAMLQALAQQSVSKLAAPDVVIILAAGVEAATLKLPLLNDVGTGGPILLKGVLLAIFGALADIKQNGNDAAKWRATGTAFVVNLVKVAFDTVAALPDAAQVTGPKLDSLKTAIAKFVADGEPLAKLPDIIQQAVA